MVLPRIVAAFRGGDDHLLSGIARLFERRRLPPARRARGRAGNPGAGGRARARVQPSDARSRRHRARLRLSARHRPVRRRPGGGGRGQARARGRGGGRHRRDARARRRAARERPRARAARRRRAGEGAEAAARTAASICRRSGRARSKASRAPGLPASRSWPARPSSPSRSSWSRRPTAPILFVIGAPAESRPMSATRRAPHVFLVAGEESGDRLGAALMAGAPARAARTRAFSGVGGAHMAAQGLPSLFPLGDLAIIGFAAIPAQLAEDPAAHPRRPPTRSIAAKPDVLVIIDSPDFTHRVARRVRARSAGDPDRRLRLARRSGPGGRAARAPCAPMSITCWRCCRSSRRRIGGSAARPAPMSAIR